MTQQEHDARAASQSILANPSAAADPRLQLLAHAYLHKCTAYGRLSLAARTTLDAWSAYQRDDSKTHESQSSIFQALQMLECALVMNGERAARPVPIASDRKRPPLPNQASLLDQLDDA